MKSIGRGSRNPARRARSIVALLGATALLAACGGGGGSSDAPAADGELSVKDLVIDVQSEPDSLDPFYRNTAPTQRYYRLTYSSILQWNEDGSLEPDLAAEMPTASEDRLTWTVKLREGVTFHDGTPLTASDVVHTINEVTNPENGAVWLAGYVFVDKAVEVDDHTVEITLTEPYAYFEGKMAMLPIISDEDEYEVNKTYATTENGSGPYKLQNMKRGDSLTLERNEDYYGDPYAFDTITFKVVPEDASRIARLTNGETNIVPDLPADQVAMVQDRGANAEVIENSASRLFAYPSMSADRPTSNADFRLAIAWAADRQRMVDQAYHGAARPNSTYLTYGTRFHDEDLGLTFGERPDVDRAKQYLDASGIELDRPLQIIAFKDAQVTSAATILQANLKEIGIEATVDAQEIAGFSDKFVTGEFDLIMFESPVSTSTGFDPDYVNGGLNSKAANNFAKFNDSEMDKRLNAAMVAPTEDEQAAAWKAVQEYDVESQGNIQLLVAQNAQGWSKGLGDYKPSALLWLNTLRDAQ